MGMPWFRQRDTRGFAERLQRMETYYDDDPGMGKRIQFLYLADSKAVQREVEEVTTTS